MKRPNPIPSPDQAIAGAAPASQTLVRGLDVLEMVATGPLALPALATRLGLARSTAHRLASALLERRYLTLVPREGYGLGPKLLELGSCAQEQTALLRVARPYMEALAEESLDTAFLCICDAGTALLLECVPGHRPLLPALRIGERTGLTQAAVGCALLMDGPEETWRDAHAQDCGNPSSTAAFVDRQRELARLGYAYDPARLEDPIRSVAAPVRGTGGAIIAAIGLASAAQYLGDGRLEAVGRAVCRAAASISGDLGCPASTARRAIRETNGETTALTTGETGEAEFLHKKEAFAAGRPAEPLEAKAAHVHDPRTEGTRRTSKADFGVR